MGELKLQRKPTNFTVKSSVFISNWETENWEIFTDKSMSEHLPYHNALIKLKTSVFVISDDWGNVDARRVSWDV